MKFSCTQSACPSSTPSFSSFSSASARNFWASSRLGWEAWLPQPLNKTAASRNGRVFLIEAILRVNCLTRGTGVQPVSKRLDAGLKNGASLTYKEGQNCDAETHFGSGADRRHFRLGPKRPIGSFRDDSLRGRPRAARRPGSGTEGNRIP